MESLVSVRKCESYEPAGLAPIIEKVFDDLGGLEDAVRRARELAGLPPEGDRPEFVRGYTLPLSQILRSEPVAAGSGGLELLCPVQIPLR